MTLGRLGAASNEASDHSRHGSAPLFRDLTHWKKVEQELGTAKKDAERSNALKTDFLAKVSHEIRTPLNAIIGFAEVIMEERLGPIGNVRYKEYLRDIHASGTHVMSLVNDLLDLSKIESGKMELAVDTVDANKSHRRMRRHHAAAGEPRARDHAAVAGAEVAAYQGRRALAAPDRPQPAVERGEVQRARRPGDRRHGVDRGGSGGDPHPRHRPGHVGGRHRRGAGAVPPAVAQRQGWHRSRPAADEGAWSRPTRPRSASRAGHAGRPPARVLALVSRELRRRAWNVGTASALLVRTRGAAAMDEKSKEQGRDPAPSDAERRSTRGSKTFPASDPSPTTSTEPRPRAGFWSFRVFVVAASSTIRSATAR